VKNKNEIRSLVRIHKSDHKVKKELILQLFKLCCHLRNLGLDLSGITLETLAINNLTMDLRLVSLNGAKFIANWENEDFDVFNVPESADSVLPGLGNVLRKMFHGKVNYSQFIQLADEIQESQRNWNLLTMDGGGARGIVSALILTELEAKLAAKNGANVPPWQVFDFLMDKVDFVRGKE
jgi:hypothetical protein